MKKILLMSAAFLALQALPVMAEDGGKEHHKGKGLEKMFEKQDTNKDGSISEDEAVAFAKERFAETDTNKDGKVTKDEIKSHMDKKRAEWEAKKKEMKADKPADAPKAE